MIEINPAELPVIWMLLSLITLTLAGYFLHRAVDEQSKHPVLEFYIALFIFIAGLILTLLLPYILYKYGMLELDFGNTTNLTAIILSFPL